MVQTQLLKEPDDTDTTPEKQMIQTKLLKKLADTDTTPGRKKTDGTDTPPERVKMSTGILWSQFLFNYLRDGQTYE